MTFHLPRDNQVADYVRYRAYFPSLTEGTVCMWLETADFNSRLASPMSYAVPAQANEWLMELVNSQTILITLRGSFATRSVIPGWAAGVAEVRKVCTYAIKFNSTTICR